LRLKGRARDARGREGRKVGLMGRKMGGKERGYTKGGVIVGGKGVSGGRLRGGEVIQMEMYHFSSS
jgi:hypothetical protein